MEDGLETVTWILRIEGTMKAKLNGCSTADGYDLEDYFPEDLECFRVDVDAYIGLENEEGFENFRFYVATPDFLKKEYERQHGVFLRHYLLVPNWDSRLIFNTINKLVSTTTGNSWKEIATILARYGYWEFEDYKPLNC